MVAATERKRERERERKREKERERKVVEARGTRRGLQNWNPK